MTEFFSRLHLFSLINKMDGPEKLLVKYKKRLDAHLNNQSLSHELDVDKVSQVNHILKRLQSQKMTLKLLEATGIGKSVNSFRHHPHLGQRAKKIVSAWKQLAVTSSGSDSDESLQQSSSEEEEEVHHEPPPKNSRKNKDHKISAKARPSKIEPPESEKPPPDLPKESRKRRSTADDGFTQDSGLSFMDILSKPDESKKINLPNGAKLKKRLKIPEASTKEQGTSRGGSEEDSGEKLDWSGGRKISPNYKPVQNRNINAYLSQFADGDSVLVKKQAKPKERESGEIDPGMFKAKHRLTRVYAGRKTKQTGSGEEREVPRLEDICKQFIGAHIDALEDTGAIPFYLLKEALEKATPAQLMNIDEKNTNLQSETEVLWETHCKKDFRGSQPDTDETWRQLYKRQLAERERRLASLASSISKKEKLNKAPQKVAKLAEAKAPRDVRRAQAKFGTYLGRGRDVPKVEEVIATRRQIDSATTKEEKRDLNLKTTSIYRPGNNFVVSTQSHEKRKATGTAPMMKKSMKMFQRAMKRK